MDLFVSCPLDMTGFIDCSKQYIKQGLPALPLSDILDNLVQTKTGVKYYFSKFEMNNFFHSNFTSYKLVYFIIYKERNIS
jgi:hypothetical protein